MKIILVAMIIAFSLAGCAEGPVRKTHLPYEQSPAVTAPHDDVVKKIQALYQKGDYQGALKLLNSTPEKNIHPNDRPEFNNLRGLVLLGQKKPLQAEQSFHKAISLNQTEEYNSYFRYNLATAQSEGGKDSEALATLNNINLENTDPTLQKKIATLKEKIVKQNPALAGSKPSEVPSESSPVAGAAAAGAVTAAASGGFSAPDSTVVNIPAPSEVYTGPVNKIRIGLLLPLSGKYESFGKKAQRSIELAFQHSSDPRAKEYELIPEDSGETVNSRLQALQKLVEQHHVIAVIGPLISKGLETLAARAAYYQVPMISIAQVQGMVSSQLFSCAISNRDQASRIVDYAMRVKGYSRFAIIAPSNKPGEEMANSFWDEVEARKGEITQFETYDPDVTDFRVPVDRALGLYYTETRSKDLEALAAQRKELNITKKNMKTAQYFALPPVVNFDAVFIADEAKTVGQIIPTFAYRDAKNLPFLGITSWNSSQLVQRAQDQAENATFPVAFNMITPPPSTKAFYDLYVGTYNAYPGELDALAFDTAALVLKVLHDSPATRDDFRKELEKLTNVESATGEISMREHHCTRKLDLYTVQKGKFVTVKE